MRISDWSSDVCSSDLQERAHSIPLSVTAPRQERPSDRCQAQPVLQPRRHVLLHRCESSKWFYLPLAKPAIFKLNAAGLCSFVMGRSLVKDRREVGKIGRAHV